MGAPDIITINTDLASVQSYPDEPSVGRIYEVAINGQGYMLADDPNEQITYRRVAIPLEPSRLATTDTPFAQSIERYAFASHPDFAAGAGQRYLNRDDSTASAFWKSQGLDPFTEPGIIQLLPDTTRALSTTYSAPRITVVGDELYVQTADDQLKYSSDGSSWTGLNIVGSTVSGLTSDGVQWYAATGSSVIRGTTSVDGSWSSTVPAVDVRWAGGRICAAATAAGSTTPNRFTTLGSDGTEEVTGGHITLDSGHTIVLGGAVAGHIYFGAYAGPRGDIYAWKLGVDSSGSFYTPFVAWTLPAGLIPAAVDVAGDSVWVRAYQPEGPSAGRALLYRCVPSADGSLTPFLVAKLADLGGSIDMPDGGVAADGDLVYFTWPEMHTGISGIGAVSLVSGGYAPWLQAGVNGQVQDVVVWHGTPVFSVAGDGVWMQGSGYVTSGTLWTSITDGASTLTKVYDDLTVVFPPFATGGSIDLSYSIDNGETYNTVGSVTTAGSVKQTFAMNLRAPSMGIQVTLNSDGTSPMSLSVVEVRYHQLGLADTMLVLPIDCSDNLTGLNGRPLPENRPGAGAARARLLESMAQQRVKVQDVDWPDTQTSEVFEVIQAETRAVGAQNQHLGKKTWRMICTLTLRKVGT